MLKLFLDPAISGAINVSHCGFRSHARASSARCTPRGRRGGGLVNPIVLVSHYISLIALSGGKSCKLVSISQMILQFDFGRSRAEYHGENLLGTAVQIESTLTPQIM